MVQWSTYEQLGVSTWWHLAGHPYFAFEHQFKTVIVPPVEVQLARLGPVERLIFALIDCVECLRKHVPQSSNNNRGYRRVVPICDTASRNLAAARALATAGHDRGVLV
jgi:hypothetical protein